MVLSTATQFGLSATRIQQVWAESSALKCALMCPISSFPLGQAALPGRRDEPQKTHCVSTVGSLLHFKLARPV